jgi:hypothetical protein
MAASLSSWWRQRCVAASRPRSPAGAIGVRPEVETLEDRLSPATLTVNSALDTVTPDADMTLREAIAIVNAGNTTGRSAQEITLVSGTLGANDAIHFAASLTQSGPATITLVQGGLVIAKAVTINGPGPGLLSISGANQFRVFTIDDFNADLLTVSLAALTITTGRDAGDAGGGIQNLEDLTLANVVVANSVGGGVLNTGFGDLTINDSTITGNTAVGVGGGVATDSLGSIVIARSTLSGNTAVGGGAIAIFESDVTISASTFTGNRAVGTSSEGNGGAIEVRNTGFATLTNCTISGNAANRGGGGIWSAGLLTIIDSTVVLNTADSDANATGIGGGIQRSSGGVSLQNSLIAGNRVLTGAGSAHDIGGTSVAGQFSLIGNAATAGGLMNDVDGNIVGVDGAGVRDVATIINTTLANNGGPTLTHALITGSPALDAGSNALIPAGVDTDQRGAGHPRVLNNTVDIGAYEGIGSAATPPSVTSVTLNGGLDPFAGVQRSRIINVTVVFDQAVQLDANAMALALHANVSFGGVPQPAGVGAIPTLVLNTTDNITWTVTFTGVGLVETGADGFSSLTDGVYDFKIDAAKVHPSGNAGVNMAANSSTTFHRLFGDTGSPAGVPNGSGGTDFTAVVNSGDNLAFRGAFNNAAGYKAYLDFNGDGVINTGDNLQFRNRFNKALTWSV